MIENSKQYYLSQPIPRIQKPPSPYIRSSSPSNVSPQLEDDSMLLAASNQLYEVVQDAIQTSKRVCEQLIDTTSIPMPLKHLTRSFKDLSVLLVAQLEWLVSNSYIGASRKQMQIAELKILDLEKEIKILKSQSSAQNRPKDQNVAIQAKMIEELLNNKPKQIHKNLQQILAPHPNEHQLLMTLEQKQFCEIIDIQAIKQIQNRFNSKTPATLQHQQAKFKDLIEQTETIIQKAFQIYAISISLQSQVKTYNETMSQLDNVFSKDNHFDIVGSLRLIKKNVDTDVVRLQQENKILRAAVDLPNEILVQIVSGLRKESKKKVQTAQGLGDLLELAVAPFDRIQQLEELLEQSVSEKQSLGNEVQTLQKQLETLKEYCQEAKFKLESQARTQMQSHYELGQRLSQLQAEKEQDIEQIAKLGNLNEELRELFEEERDIMNEERLVLEEQLESINNLWEQKLGVVKSKLLLIVGSVGSSMNLQVETLPTHASLDEICSYLQKFLLFKLQKQTIKDDRKFKIETSFIPETQFKPPIPYIEDGYNKRVRRSQSYSGTRKYVRPRVNQEISYNKQTTDAVFRDAERNSDHFNNSVVSDISGEVVIQTEPLRLPSEEILKSKYSEHRQSSSLIMNELDFRSLDQINFAGVDPQQVVYARSLIQNVKKPSSISAIVEKFHSDKNVFNQKLNQLKQKLSDLEFSKNNHEQMSQVTHSLAQQNFRFDQETNNPYENHYADKENIFNS